MCFLMSALRPSIWEAGVDGKSEICDTVAHGRSLLVEHVLDVRSVGFFDKRWIVSRKRNKNVFDYTSIWKKNLLKNSSVDDGLADFVDAWQ